MTNITCYFPVTSMMEGNIGQGQIWEGRKQKLLSVIIDKNMKFDEQVLKATQESGRQDLCIWRIIQLFKPRTS